MVYTLTKADIKYKKGLLRLRMRKDIRNILYSVYTSYSRPMGEAVLAITRHLGIVDR